MANMMSICNNNESLNEMVVSYREGNEEAFSEIYAACCKIAEGLFYKSSKEQQGCLSFDDLLQDSVVKVWKYLDRFDESKGSFRTWFSAIFKNTLIDAKKASKIRMAADISSIDETQICAVSSFGFYKNETAGDENSNVRRLNNSSDRMLEDEYIQNETLEEILDSMENALSAQQKEAMSMFYLDGMSIEEISKAQGCSINSVKSRLHQSRNKLKPCLEERGLAS